MAIRATRTSDLSIHDFLLSYVLGDADRGLKGMHLRSDVERHELRTTTVGSRRGASEVRDRCSICPTEDGWPCRALRVMASPYARHPAYRQEWQVERPDAVAIPAPRSSP